MKRIDIANDPIPAGDPNVPGRTQITKADPPIGPLSGNWRETVTPVMTVYKLVSWNRYRDGLKSGLEVARWGKSGKQHSHSKFTKPGQYFLARSSTYYELMK